MNKDNIEASVQKLHDGTVGTLNTDLDQVIEPLTNLVKTLQSRTTGQVNAVAIESVHRDPNREPGSAPPDETVGGLASRTDTVLIIATLDQRERRREAAADLVEPPDRRVRRRRPAADLRPGSAAVRNAWRVFAFDIAAPLAAIAALLTIGYALDWRVWWVAVCSVLCTLIVEGMIVNFVLFRRDSVTVGTDDDGPGLRLAVVGLSTAALVAAVLVTYTQWTESDRDLARNMDDVVQIAVKFAESTMTYSPAEPDHGDRSRSSHDGARTGGEVQGQLRHRGEKPSSAEHFGASPDDLGGGERHLTETRLSSW